MFFKKFPKVFLLITFITIALDQVSKILLINFLSEARQLHIIEGFFSIVYVWNKGISFGLFNNPGTNQLFLILMSCVIICTLTYVFIIKSSPRCIELVALGLIIGGALGNILDRVLYGAVFDFLLFYWRQYQYPAFNIADSAICIGAFFLIYSAVISEKGEIK
jgi:signal peptidase II